MDTDYDYVIVGAGSAGCVIAARLAAGSDARVLLIEAGPPDERPEIHDGSLASTMALWAPGEPTDWGYQSAPQAGLAGREVPIARGKVWGGCSSVNAMLFVRGNRMDYDGWAAAGNPGWGYDDVLPLFRRMETFAGDGELRGHDGPLSVRPNAEPTPVSELLFEAGPEVGLADQGRDFDYNGARQDGTVFRYQATKTADGHRSSTATAYLRPALGQANLTVLSNATASRIVIEDGRAVGVDLRVAGQPGEQRIRAQAEVVVSCGAFGSPQLLLLSGLGPAAQLREHGLPVLADLPGVGENLQDHLILGVAYLNRRSQEDPPGLIAETGCFTHTAGRDPGRTPDLQLTFGGLKFIAPQYDRPGPGFTFAPVLVQPHSRGRVSLASPDPADNARVEPDYLSDPRDLDVLLAGITLSRAIAHSRAFADYTGDELGPGDDVRTRSELAEYVRGNAGTLWHPVGTCAMGPGDDAVVDAELRVRGVANLRVADASVMPKIVTGNTNAACLMIGEKAADLILATLSSRDGAAAGRPNPLQERAHA